MQLEVFPDPSSFDIRHSMVAEVDGQVLVDYLMVNPSDGCRALPQALNGDRYAFQMPRDTWAATTQGAPQHEGVIAGVVGESTPRRVIKYQADPQLSANWTVSEQWILQLRGKRTGYTWVDGAPSTTVYDSALDPEGAPGHQTTAVGSTVFVEEGGAFQRGVSVWTPSSGQQLFLRWVGDTTQGVGNFGTDETDMVWTYGQGKQAGQDGFSTLSVMTAPYTSDPSALPATARRVRADLQGLTPYRWAVGCGYAARLISTDAIINGLYITRLSDGRAWVIPGGQSTSQTYAWHVPIGITCDEVFTELTTNQGYMSLARIRLDSLGAGSPAD